jgi:hypothetical protein
VYFDVHDVTTTASHVFRKDCSQAHSSTGVVAFPRLACRSRSSSLVTGRLSMIPMPIPGFANPSRVLYNHKEITFIVRTSYNRFSTYVHIPHRTSLDRPTPNHNDDAFFNETIEYPARRTFPNHKSVSLTRKVKAADLDNADRDIVAADKILE